MKSRDFIARNVPFASVRYGSRSRSMDGDFLQEEDEWAVQGREFGGSLLDVGPNLERVGILAKPITEVFDVDSRATSNET
jgi:hypothetical protein